MGNRSSRAGAPSGECPAIDRPSSVDEPTCPVPKEQRNQAVYNVYSQRINGPGSPISSSPLDAVDKGVLDPKNMMPLEPNQQPCPGQIKPLSTARMESKIPKGGTDSTWLYPSPQMFFNGVCHPCGLSPSFCTGPQPACPWCSVEAQGQRRRRHRKPHGCRGVGPQQ
jgi:cytochrome c heme-lyase